MRYGIAIMALLAATLLSSTVHAQMQPSYISYQGQLSDGITPFNGTATFKFAIVRVSDGVSIWSNDGTSVDGSEPTGSVQQDVVQGIFSFLLGGEQGMPPLTADLLDVDSELALRMWVDIQSGSGFEIMSDQSIAGTFLAMKADAAMRSLGDFDVPGTLTTDGELVANAGVRLPDGSLLTSSSGGGNSGWTAVGEDVHTSGSGNVGIGTMTPDAKLQVVGGTFKIGTAKNSDGLPSGKSILSSDGVNTDLVPALDDWGFVRILDGNSPGAITLENKSVGHIRSFIDVDAGVAGPLLLQFGGGFVGVGISNPIADLHVRKTIQLGDDVTEANNFHFGPGFWNNQNAFRFWNGNFGSGSLVMTMLPSGMVGIGTDNPQATLDVAGVVRAGSGLRLPDGTLLTSGAAFTHDYAPFTMITEVRQFPGNNPSRSGGWEILHHAWASNQPPFSLDEGLRIRDPNGQFRSQWVPDGRFLPGTTQYLGRQLSFKGQASLSESYKIYHDADLAFDFGLTIADQLENSFLRLRPGSGVEVGSSVGDNELRVLSSVGEQTQVVLQGNDAWQSNGGSVRLFDDLGLNTVWLWAGKDTGGGASYGGEINIFDGAGNVSIRLRGSDGRAKVGELQITGGADISEQFDVAGTGGMKPAPGMVVSIDPRNPGSLTLSRVAYDKRVAGVISGAGGVKPGMLMRQEGSIADGELPVALTGRVYCWVDAERGTIQPGDLLTTSDTPGHAMRVGDNAMAHGAVLGKAMTSLEEGKGLVLVLVNLQ